MSNITPVDRLKHTLSAESVQEQFNNTLKENSGLFTASLIDLYTNDKALQGCNANAVVVEALKAATLKLPINKQLGFAYIVPFKKNNVPIPTFIIGYKGLIQLAMRTGQYKYLNTGMVYEGQLKGEDMMTGMLDLTGTKTSNKVIGYFAYLELLNGFTKVVYQSKDDIVLFAQNKCPSYKNKSSAWHTDFDAMSRKTVLRDLLMHWGILSVDMAAAISSDGDGGNYENSVRQEIEENANTEMIDVGFTEEPETKDDGFGSGDDIPPAADGPGF